MGFLGKISSFCVSFLSLFKKFRLWNFKFECFQMELEKKFNGICGLFHPSHLDVQKKPHHKSKTHTHTKKIFQLRVILIKCNKILGNIPWSIPCKQLLMLIYLILLNVLRFELTKYIFLIVLVMFALKVETTLYLNAKHHQRF